MDAFQRQKEWALAGFLLKAQRAAFKEATGTLTQRRQAAMVEVIRLVRGEPNDHQDQT